MSAFYVGQRVRVVHAYESIEAIGREGTITTAEFDTCSRRGPYRGYGVSVDGIGPISPRGLPYAFRREALEPILPPGLESLEEINALYEPSPIEVRT